jgi:hypothetical protein
LTYLLGDVLRIFAGDFKAGEMMGVQATQAMFFWRRAIDADSDCHGCPVPDVEVSGDSLGNHRRCHNSFCF